MKKGKFLSENFDSVETIDANSNYVSPGFIDLHIHGSGGAGYMKCDTYDPGGGKVIVESSKAIFEDGTLAGSVLKLNEALKNLSTVTSMTVDKAANAVTKIPANKLGLKKGELKERYDSDIVIFDENFSIISTIVSGKFKYQRN